MLRNSATVVLVAALVLVGGCSKKHEDGTKVGGDTNGATGAAHTTGSAKAVNWEKVERVPFARLQGLLPDTALGFKRTNLGGQTIPDGESTYSEATGDYEGPNETGLSVVAQDNPVRARDSLSSKTTTFKGFPVVQESENGDESDVTILVGERFVVHAHGRKLKVAQLKSVIEKMDLAKLASWKGEGLK